MERIKRGAKERTENVPESKRRKIKKRKENMEEKG